MAPEVIVHEPYDTSCDVFSYGVVVWEILTHTTPFKVLTPGEVATVAGAYTRPFFRST
jgi:serine/threonine protein kinase